MLKNESQIQDILVSLADGLEALTKSLAKEVVSEIQSNQRLKNESTKPEGEEFLTTSEACEFLKVCPETLSNRRRAGLIPPPYKNGRFNMYKKSDLRNSIRKGRRDEYNG